MIIIPLNIPPSILIMDVARPSLGQIIIHVCMYPGYKFMFFLTHTAFLMAPFPHDIIFVSRTILPHTVQLERWPNSCAITQFTVEDYFKQNRLYKYPLYHVHHDLSYQPFTLTIRYSLHPIGYNPAYLEQVEFTFKLRDLILLDYWAMLLPIEPELATNILCGRGSTSH